MRKLTFILTLLLLSAFVLEFSLNIRVSNIDGLSLKNLAIYMLILLMIIGNSVLGEPIIARGPVTVPAIAFILYCTLSLLLTGFFNLVPGYSVSQELRWFKSAMDPYILLTIYFSLIKDEKTIKRLLFLLITVYVVFLAITLLGSFNLLSVGRVYINDKLGRTRGAFSEWNQYPLYLSVFFPLLITYFRQSARNIVKMMVGCILLIAAYEILLSGSRGGLICLATALGAYYLLESRQRLIKKLVGVTIVYVCAVVALIIISYLLPEGSADILLSKITGKFFQEHNVHMEYTSGRFGLWTAALPEFFRSPIFGTGWRSFIPLFGGNSHNDFLLYLVTTGVIGVSLYVWVFMRMIKAVSRYRSVDTDNRSLYNAFIAGIVAYLAGSFLVNVYTPAYFVFMYAAVMVKLGLVVQQGSVSVEVPVSSENRVLVRGRRN